jgi:hypothetical protein
LTSPLLHALSPCRGPAVPFRPRAAAVFQFTSRTASSLSLPADRPHCVPSLAPPCSNWSFSAPPGLKAELGHASWQPTPFPSNSRLIAPLASPYLPLPSARASRAATGPRRWWRGCAAAVRRCVLCAHVASPPRASLGRFFTAAGPGVSRCCSRPRSFVLLGLRLTGTSSPCRAVCHRRGEAAPERLRPLYLDLAASVGL